MKYCEKFPSRINPNLNDFFQEFFSASPESERFQQQHSGCFSFVQTSWKKNPCVQALPKHS
jgi:hypothetical protein